MLALGSSVAAAEPSKEELQVARTLFGQAMAEENQEHWQQALTKFESVQAIKTSPSVRFHIALCEEKLGRLAAALSDYEAARVAAHTENSKEVLATVEEPIARLTADVPHVTLMLDSPPAGAQIEIDGRNLSSVGFGVPIPLDPGPHKIVVSAPAGEKFTHSVVLQLKGDVGVQIVLRLEGAKAVPPQVAPPTEPKKSRHPERPYAIATTAGAVVTLGAGIGMILGAGAVKSSKDGTCSLDDCSAKSTIRVLDWAGAGSLLAAAGFTAASIVLWTRPAKTETATRGLHTQFAFGPGRLVLQGTFE
jgi:hypothetical protein